MTSQWLRGTRIDVNVDSSDNGHATDHHFVHIGSMATRGWGAIIVEMTAVV